MKSVRVFIIAAAATTCLSLAGHHVGAKNGGPAGRGSAATSGTAVIHGCEVMAELIRKHDGIYAMLSASNVTEQAREVEFHYVATCMPGASMAMRMIPQAREVKRGKCTFSIAADRSDSAEILIQQQPQRREEPRKKSALQRAPDTWTLLVSPSPIPGASGAGALVPTPVARAELDKGQMVVAMLRGPGPRKTGE